MWDVPGPGIKLSYIGRQLPHHWATREAPQGIALKTLPPALITFLLQNVFNHITGIPVTLIPLWVKINSKKKKKKKKDTQITPFKLRMSTSIRINEAQKFLSPGRISLLLSALMCFSAPSFCSSRCYTWILCSPWNVHVKHWTQPCTVESWGPVAVLRLPVFFPPCFLLIQYTLWGFPTTATALHSLHYYHRYNPTISYQVDLFMQWGFFSPICFQEEFDATLNQRTRYS